MRSKIPQLREALAQPLRGRPSRDPGRPAVRAHRHARHAIAKLDEKIEAMLAPHAQDRRAAVHDPRCRGPHRAGADRRVRPGHEPLPDRRAPRLVGGHLPRPPRVRRTQAARAAPARAEWLTEALTESAKAAARTKGTYLAAHHAQLRGRRGERQGDRRDPPRHPRRLLPHRPRPGPVPRARPRLAAQALLARAPRPPPATPARSARLQGHPRAKRARRRPEHAPPRLLPRARHRSARSPLLRFRRPCNGFTSQPRPSSPGKAGPGDDLSVHRGEEGRVPDLAHVPHVAVSRSGFHAWAAPAAVGRARSTTPG